MSNKQKILFIVLFAVLGFVALQVPVAKLEGSRSAFTLFDLFAPIATGFLGSLWGVVAVAGMELINLAVKGVSSFDAVMAIRLITPLAAALYFSRKSLFNVIVPVAAIIAFLIMPESRQAWYFALLWLIPIVAYFLQDRWLLARALGATFTAHAVGGALWAIFNPLPASVWSGLIPIVIKERAIFALGIAVSYLVMNNVLALVAKKVPRVLPLVNQKYALSHPNPLL
ncbi:MAG: hypothetical protein AAB420_03300 [Patescibacteria group bacterium]